MSGGLLIDGGGPVTYTRSSSVSPLTMFTRSNVPSGRLRFTNSPVSSNCTASSGTASAAVCTLVTIAALAVMFKYSAGSVPSTSTRTV